MGIVCTIRVQYEYVLYVLVLLQLWLLLSTTCEPPYWCDNALPTCQSKRSAVHVLLVPMLGLQVMVESSKSLCAWTLNGTVGSAGCVCTNAGRALVCDEIWRSGSLWEVLLWVCYGVSTGIYCIYCTRLSCTVIAVLRVSSNVNCLSPAILVPRTCLHHSCCLRKSWLTPSAHVEVAVEAWRKGTEECDNGVVKTGEGLEYLY